MQQENGLFAPLINAMNGRGSPPPRRNAPAAPARPNTQSYTEERAAAQRRANREAAGRAAVQRTQAARPNRPLTDAETAAILARYR